MYVQRAPQLSVIHSARLPDVQAAAAAATVAAVVAVVAAAAAAAQTAAANAASRTCEGPALLQKGDSKKC